MPRMKKRPASLAAVALLILVGCAETPPPAAPAEVSRPAEILEIGGGELAPGLRFPGRVRAVQRAELAFDVPGKLVELAVREGESLSAGALIARLEPAAFESRLNAARAELDKARSDYQRVQALWDKSKAVARAEVEQKRTALEVARSAYAAARKDLDDTRLQAPFAGVIARRYVENYQNVQAKEPIVSLQDTGALEVVIHVPERVVRAEPKRAAGYATFPDLPGQRFPVTLKSFATEADAQTQTYEVVLGLERPEGLTLLPGMSAEVFPAAGGGDTTTISIPLKAVVAGADGTPTVWVVDPDTSRVSRRAIEVGAVNGDRLVVLSGLQTGELIVTAGVHHVRDGMPVRPL